MMLSYISTYQVYQEYIVVFHNKNGQKKYMGGLLSGFSIFLARIFSALPNSKNRAFLKHHFASINFLNESKLFSQKWSETISKLIVASTLIKRNFP